MKTIYLLSAKPTVNPTTMTKTAVKNPFGESNVNSPGSSIAEESSSVLSCSPSKQRNHNNIINSQLSDNSDKKNTLSPTEDSANIFDSDSKENQGQLQTTVITPTSKIENPFDKYTSDSDNAKQISCQEQSENEIEVVTVLEDSFDDEVKDTDAKQSEDQQPSSDTEAQNVLKNPFDQLLQEQKEPPTTPTKVELPIQEKITEKKEDEATGNNTDKALTIDSSAAPETPKARYLRAIQQTAAKCKTMVATPKEIITGPNPTPKSSVSAQLKRVENGQDVQDESPDGTVQWIPSSQNKQQQQERRSAFDIALTTRGDDTPERHTNGSGLSHGGTSTSLSDVHAFRTIPEYQDNDNHSMRASSSDELSVKEEILDGTDSSYLQLDVESVASMHTFDIDEETKPAPQDARSSTMESLKSSLAMIWNTSSTSLKTFKKDENGIPKEVQNNEVPTNIKKINTDSVEGPSVAPSSKKDSAMNSLKSSFAMIWNRKPARHASSPGMGTPSKGDIELSDASSKKTIKHNGGSARKLTGKSKTARARLLSEEEEEDEDVCSTSSRRERLPMGSQYLERGRSPARDGERVITPVPSGDDKDDAVDEIMECDGSNRSSSFDSLDDFWGVTAKKTPSKKGSNNVNLSFHYSSPKTVKSVNTSATEDSFIKAAMNAKDTDRLQITYNEGFKPLTRDWQPPEKDKEEDAMIRAIMERPDLVDKTEKDGGQLQNWNCTNFRRCVLITLAILLATATITGCLVCGITGSCLARGDDRDKSSESPKDKVLPLVLDLPEYTRDSLRSYHTAQAKAFLWLEKDPNILYYSETRKIQRFALATLYFSTKIAQNWTESTSWLDYDIHECFWFSRHAEGSSGTCEDDEYKRLVLPKNNLRGQLPPELTLLTSLVELDLSHNVLFGPIPTQFGLLTSLDKLWLDKNQLNGGLPSELGALVNLRDMSLATNDLKGEIPSEIGLLSNLKTLRLFYNFLEGSLPTEVGLLSQLELLDVDVNQLSSTIPSEIGMLTNLQELWLDWNNFVGPFPTELGELEHLQKLYLGRAFIDTPLRDDNWLESGDYSIPSEFGRLANLRELYMDNNDLTGFIPEELSALTLLETASFDHNRLTDSVSPGICGLFDGKLEVLSVDCAKVLCNCGCTCVVA